jgi:multimeric flavodoxin WrbA
MRICIINGSPKGNYSITLQTALYIQKHFPGEEFEIINVGQKIKLYEKDMREAISGIQKATGEDSDSRCDCVRIYNQRPFHGCHFQVL